MIKKRPAHVPSGRHNPTPPAKVINFYKHSLQNLKAGGLRKFRKPYQAVMTVATPARGRDNTANYDNKPRPPRLVSFFLERDTHTTCRLTIAFVQGTPMTAATVNNYVYQLIPSQPCLEWLYSEGPPDRIMFGHLAFWDYSQARSTAWLEYWNHTIRPLLTPAMFVGRISGVQVFGQAQFSHP